MKKLIILSLFLVLTMVAFGQVNFSLGANAGFALSSLTDKISVDADNYGQMSLSDNILTVGAFFDATYARLGVSFARSLGASAGLKAVVGGSTVTDTTSNSPSGYYVNMVDIRLLGKYPIDLASNIKLWPTAGVMYSMLLSMDMNGDGTADDLTNVDMNDFYIVGGCGLDAFITEQLYFTAAALFNWNLTPIQVKDYTAPPSPQTESVTQWAFNAEVGIGYKL